MTDIEIAKKYLKEENLTIIAVKNKKIVFKSKEKGIKPIYTLALEMKEVAKDSVLADRVIGKGAAILCKHIGIKEVYGEVISESAMEVLEKANIKFSYGDTTEHIKNRDKTGLCPIENMAMDIEDQNLLMKRIGEFLGQ